MTEHTRKRITIEPPSGMVILAARHLDPTEGPVQVDTIVDTSTRSAINAVLRYIATAHNQTDQAGCEHEAELEHADESVRRALAQRQEMAEERYAWQERGDRAEAAIARVRALAEEYPAGIDTALIHAALDVPEPAGADTTPAEPATVTDPAWLRQQLYAAIESEIYEYRERTMFWPEVGVTKEIARLATRGAMSVRDRHVAQLRQRLELAAEWTPPPPGSIAERLPETMLDLIRDRLPDYLSTACQTADTLACAACYPGSGVPRPQYDEIREHAERLHERCRLNNKFTGQLCGCGCHPTEEQATVVGGGR